MSERPRDRLLLTNATVASERDRAFEYAAGLRRIE
jgi:hypothetical protein